MTQLDIRPLPLFPLDDERMQQRATRETALSFEDTVEMIGAVDRPAWMSVRAIGRSGDPDAVQLRVGWHLDRERDFVRMTLTEARAFAESLLETCEEIERRRG